MRKALFALSMVCILLTACSGMEQIQSNETNSEPIIPSTEKQGDNGFIIAGSDLEMQSAIHLAQATLESFIYAFQHPKLSQVYFSIYVQIPVYEQENVAWEVFWVDELTYENNQFEGTVVGDGYYTDVNSGDHIVVNSPEIIDWMIVEDGRLIGGFTLVVRHSQLGDSERKQVDAELWYTIPDEPELPSPDTIEM